MTQALLSLNADSRTTSPARNSSIFKMSDGALVAIWVEGINGPGTDRVVRRYRSEDGITWTRMSDLLLGSLLGTTDPDGSKQIYPLFSQSVDGADTIAAFAIAVPASASYMFVMNYSAIQKDFTSDTIIGSYTPTNAWDGLGTGTGTTRSGYTDYGRMLYDSAHTDHIVIFDALVSGQEYIYLIAWDTATGKITEQRFTNAASATCRFPDMAIVTGTPSTIALVYQRTNYAFRTYTYDGATFSVGAAEEVIPGSPTISSGSPRLLVNNSGTFQIFYENFTTNAALITRERTGVATYSAAVEIATDLPYGTYLTTVGPEDQFALKKVGTDDWYVFYKKTTTNFRGELYYVRRNAGVWGTQTAWKTGANGFNHPSTGPFVVGSDHKLHMLYSRGSQVYPGSWSLFYDFIYDGTPSAPTNVTPSTAGETSATPTITAKYVQNRAGDNLGKYRVLVKRDSDSTVFWDTGSSGTAWGGAAITPGGTFSIVYAGTALVEGTVYRVEVSFWDTQESYGGPLSTAVTFAWNDPPSKIAVALTSDPTNGRQRTALYPLAPAAGTEKAPVTGDLWRKLSTDAQFTSLKSGLAFTAPTTQTGFSAYRQLPEKIARNLVINGGLLNGSHGMTMHANASVVAEATSVTGYAARLMATAGSQYAAGQFIPVEAGKAYSLAIQVRSDGINEIFPTYNWYDANLAAIPGGDFFIGSAYSGTAWAERSQANVIAPGNARYIEIRAYSGAAGVMFATAFRVMQQTGAPAAWTTAHQQYLSRGLAIYEASTNLLADGDMEAADTASWTATSATLAKNTTNPFAGTRRLSVTNTAANGSASQTGSLAAGQAVTLSARVIGGDAGAGVKLTSTPSNTVIGSDLGSSSDWVARRVSGVISGGDTGWKAELVGGSGTTTVSQFDNAAVENKAYDTMNADPSGQAFALAARTVSDVRLPLPSGLDFTSIAFVIVYRPDVITTAVQRRVLQFAVSASEFLSLLHETNNGIYFYKSRGGVSSFVSDGIAANPAAGDTLALAARFSTSAGLKVWVAKNGGAVSSYNGGGTTPEAMLAPTGTPIVYLGKDVGGAGQADGTIGAARILKAGVSDAAIDALVADPYQQPTDNDLAPPWQFEGFTSQVPSFDDRLVKLGTSYDYRAVGTAAAATPTQSTGQQVGGSVATIGDWWLRSSADPTKDVKLHVEYSSGFSRERGRPLAIGLPLQGGPKSVIYGKTPYAADISLSLLYADPVLRDTTIAALDALLAIDDAMYLQDGLGGLHKVKFAAPIRSSRNPDLLRNELSLIEVS